MTNIQTYRPLLIFLPRFDGEIRKFFAGDGLDKALGELKIGNKRNTEICSSATDVIAIGKFFTVKTFGNIDDKIDFSLRNHIDRLRLFFFRWPINCFHRESMLPIRSEEHTSELQSQSNLV